MSKIGAIPVVVIVLLLTACSSGTSARGSSSPGSSVDASSGGNSASGAPDCASLIPELNRISVASGAPRTVSWTVSDNDVTLLSAEVRKKSCAYSNGVDAIESFVPASALTYAAYTKVLAAGGFVDNHDGNWYNPAGPQVGVSDGTDLKAAGLLPPSADKVLGKYFLILDHPGA